jgi:hypothetical protein
MTTPAIMDLGLGVEFATIAQGKDFVSKSAEIGCKCPCCDSLVHTWKKYIVSNATASLVRLVAFYSNKPQAYHLDIFNQIPKDRNFSQLKLWGLIEEIENKDETKKTSGYFIPTQKGYDFVCRGLLIPKFVFTLNNQIIRFEEPMINIMQALGDRFNYKSLMDNNFN